MVVKFISINIVAFPSRPLLQSGPRLPFTCKPPCFTLHLGIRIAKCQQHDNPAPPSTQPHQPYQLKETQEVISLLLQEFGVSAEESDSISLNCPGYSRMLLDGVTDLEELASWETGDVKGFGELGFRDKVIHMAKKKGDVGKVAFLESVGLSFLSAMNVARYLPGESLPILVDRVKYMKEMLFSGTDDTGLIARYARRMMTQLAISIDDDLQQTLSFFEKIEARRGGLDMLDSSDVSFRYLVESFPRILLLPIDSHLKPAVKYLERIGVPKDRVRSIFLLFPPAIDCDIEEINRKLLFFKKVGAVDKDFGKMLVKYPWILSTGIQDNYEEIHSFFNMEKVSKIQTDKAIKSWPILLGCSGSQLMVMVEQFAKLGVRQKKLGQVIASCPQLLLKRPEEFLQVVSFLEDIGFDRKSAGEILVRCPEVFGASIEETIKRKVKFLADIGVPSVHCPRVIRKYPELLVSDVNTLRPRIEYLTEIGLSKKDVAFMIRRFSPLVGYSIDEVLKPKYEFLVNTMKKPVEDLAAYPRYFSYSLEKKIIPRFRVLKERSIDCSLQDMLHKNDEAFVDEFMGPGHVLVPPSLRQRD